MSQSNRLIFCGALLLALADHATALSIPAYQRLLPEFAIQVAYSPKTFEQSPTIKNSNLSIGGLNIQFDYQPAFIQRLGWGILDFGVLLGMYPVTPGGVLTSNAFSLLSFGAQFKYQAKYIINQIVVPFASYGVEILDYRFINAGWKDVSLVGGSLGLFILLDPFDPQAAIQFYNDYSVVRTYLVIEARGTSSGDQLLPTNVTSWFYGVRFEF
jgi:hypothetical protein